MWTPEREDLLIELAGTIDDDAVISRVLIFDLEADRAGAIFDVHSEAQLRGDGALLELCPPSHGSSAGRSRSWIGPIGPSDVRTKSMSSEYRSGGNKVELVEGRSPAKARFLA